MGRRQIIKKKNLENGKKMTNGCCLKLDFRLYWQESLRILQTIPLPFSTVFSRHQIKGDKKKPRIFINPSFLFFFHYFLYQFFDLNEIKNDVTFFGSKYFSSICTSLPVCIFSFSFFFIFFFLSFFFFFLFLSKPPFMVNPQIPTLPTQSDLPSKQRLIMSISFVF